MGLTYSSQVNEPSGTSIHTGVVAERECVFDVAPRPVWSVFPNEIAAIVVGLVADFGP